MQTNSTRRDAARAARELMAARFEYIGDLSEHRTSYQDAQAAVARAQDQLVDAENRYRQARETALAGGWSPDDLDALGYPALRPRAKRNETRSPREPNSRPTSDVDPEETDSALQPGPEAPRPGSGLY